MVKGKILKLKYPTYDFVWNTEYYSNWQEILTGLTVWTNQTQINHSSWNDKRTLQEVHMDHLLTDNSATLWGYLTGLWNSHISLLHVRIHTYTCSETSGSGKTKHRIMVAAVTLSHYKGKRQKTKTPKFIYNLSAALQLCIYFWRMLCSPKVCAIFLLSTQRFKDSSSKNI